MSQAPALLYESVTKTYSRSHLGRTTVSRGIESLSLSVPRGDAFGLLGLNGSGKTTTFKLALGLLRPNSGKVEVLGGSPRDRAIMSRVGFMPELPYFNPASTAEEALRFYGRLSSIPEEGLGARVDEALALVGLSAQRGRRIGELSKGTVQRVGLAQAVLHAPELVILDEPVSGLDPLAIKDFRDGLKRLNEAGTTLVVSSHSISELEKLCRRVGILRDGRLVRTLEQKEWRGAKGGLEELFVETVR